MKEDTSILLKINLRYLYSKQYISIDIGLLPLKKSYCIQVINLSLIPSLIE